MKQLIFHYIRIPIVLEDSQAYYIVQLCGILSHIHGSGFLFFVFFYYCIIDMISGAK